MTVPCGRNLTLEQRNSVGRKAQQRQMHAELFLMHMCCCGENVENLRVSFSL